MNPEMAPEELEAMMAQGGNGGPPEEQAPPPPETSLQALDAAVKATANNARATTQPEDARNFAQAAFFLAQATAKLVPPPDPNEMAKVQVDREKVQTGAQVDRERMAADAVKAAADRKAQAQMQARKVRVDGRDTSGRPASYSIEGGS